MTNTNEITLVIEKVDVPKKEGSDRLGTIKMHYVNTADPNNPNNQLSLTISEQKDGKYTASLEYNAEFNSNESVIVKEFQTREEAKKFVNSAIRYAGPSKPIDDNIEFLKSLCDKTNDITISQATQAGISNKTILLKNLSGLVNLLEENGAFNDKVITEDELNKAIKSEPAYLSTLNKMIGDERIIQNAEMSKRAKELGFNIQIEDGANLKYDMLYKRIAEMAKENKTFKTIEK